jgi:hypothetical protein
MRKALHFIQRPVMTFWGSTGVVVCYLLSTGPVFWVIWNIHLPVWCVNVIRVVYGPFISAVNRSDVAQYVWLIYSWVWVDRTTRSVGQPATPMGPDPVAPPFVVEAAGILIAAWLMGTFVRWLNQRGSPPLRPIGTDWTTSPR